MILSFPRTREVSFLSWLQYDHVVASICSRSLTNVNKRGRRTLSGGIQNAREDKVGMIFNSRPGSSGFMDFYFEKKLDSKMFVFLQLRRWAAIFGDVISTLQARSGDSDVVFSSFGLKRVMRVENVDPIYILIVESWLYHPVKNSRNVENWE